MTNRGSNEFSDDLLHLKRWHGTISAVPRGIGPVGWLKGSPFGGKVPAFFPSGRFRLYHAEARFQTADQRQTCQVREVVFWIGGQLPKNLVEAVDKVRVGVTVLPSMIPWDRHSTCPHYTRARLAIGFQTQNRQSRSISHTSPSAWPGYTVHGVAKSQTQLSN